MAYVPTQNEIDAIYKKEFEKRESPNVMQKRTSDNLLKQRQAEQQKKKKGLEGTTFAEVVRRIFGF